MKKLSFKIEVYLNKFYQIKKKKTESKIKKEIKYSEYCRGFCNLKAPVFNSQAKKY